MSTGYLEINRCENPHFFSSLNSIFFSFFEAAGKTDLSGNIDEQETSSTIQHKANPYPIVEPLDDTELRVNIHRTELIVVASLIDKQTNLGGTKKKQTFVVEIDFLFSGLCRTGEIFGVKEMVIGSIRVLDDPQFLNLSMTAHKWLRIKQVDDQTFRWFSLK